MISESNTLALPVFAVSSQYTMEDDLKKQIIENIPSYKTLFTLNDKKIKV